MPKITDLVSQIKVKNLEYESPEWWLVQHKLKRAVKYNAVVKSVAKKARFNTRLEVSSNSLEREAAFDQYARGALSDLDLPKYEIFAPWNSMFRNSKPIITFKK